MISDQKLLHNMKFSYLYHFITPILISCCFFVNINISLSTEFIDWLLFHIHSDGLKRMRFRAKYSAICE